MFDSDKIKAAVTSIIEAIGEDPQREGLVGTPRRVAEMYAELFKGLNSDPKDVLSVSFEEGHREMIVLKDVSITCCPFMVWLILAISPIMRGVSSAPVNWPE